MAISNINFDDLSERDLVEQIQAGVPEGVLVDYKRDMYGRAEADIKEFLKDVSSFANTAGGHLILGVDETGGVPTCISALSGDSDQELQRLENLARDGIEPRIAGLRMKVVPVATGGFVIVLRIPKSWNPPHRVSARNTNRIYGRNSAGAYEFSVEELRVVFTFAASAVDRVRAFRAERLAKIDSGEAIVPLAQNLGRLVLHLVPTSGLGLSNQIDLERAQAAENLLRPLASMGRTSRINFDGFSNIHIGRDGQCWSYTQIFRNGAIEAVKVRVVSDLHGNQRVIPTLDFDKWIFECLPGYFSALQRLDVQPPIILMITLQGVRGARLGVGMHYVDPPLIDRSVLELPEIIIERYGTEDEYQRAARPAFDALWNTGGFSRSQHFDETGRWDPQWRQRRSAGNP
jgi:Putative DNA-binding domain